MVAFLGPHQRIGPQERLLHVGTSAGILDSANHPSQAQAEGISQRTLERARGCLGVVATTGQNATWELPPDEYRQPRAGEAVLVGGVGGGVDGGIYGGIQTHTVEPNPTDARASENTANEISLARARARVQADFEPLEAAARFDAMYPPKRKT